jgi:hypothetical protein
MRAREYYDLFPELTELATSEDQVVRPSSVLWIELKTRDGEYSGKRRVGIPRSELAQFFVSGEPTEQMRAIQEAAYGRAATEVLAELLELRARLREPLEPNAIVCYRRSAFQNPEGTLRLTFDRELSAFAPKPGLVESDKALVRSSLGKRVAEEPRCVVELKSKGEAPEWLLSLLAAEGAVPSEYSKFRFASEAIHGSL